FVLPSNQVVLAVVFTFTTHPLDNPSAVDAIANVLKQSITEKIRIDEQGLAAYIETLPVGHAPGDGWEPDTVGTNGLHPERHQLVFITRRRDVEQVPGTDVIDDIVYRKTPPYSQEFARLHKPDQLNLLDNDVQIKLGVVTPYVSLLYGHEHHV